VGRALGTPVCRSCTESQGGRKAPLVQPGAGRRPPARRRTVPSRRAPAGGVPPVRRCSTTTVRRTEGSAALSSARCPAAPHLVRRSGSRPPRAARSARSGGTGPARRRCQSRCATDQIAADRRRGQQRDPPAWGVGQVGRDPVPRAHPSGASSRASEATWRTRSRRSGSAPFAALGDPHDRGVVGADLAQHVLPKFSRGAGNHTAPGIAPLGQPPRWAGRRRPRRSTTRPRPRNPSRSSTDQLHSRRSHQGHVPVAVTQFRKVGHPGAAVRCSEGPQQLPCRARTGCLAHGPLLCAPPQCLPTPNLGSARPGGFRVPYQHVAVAMRPRPWPAGPRSIGCGIRTPPPARSAQMSPPARCFGRERVIPGHVRGGQVSAGDILNRWESTRPPSMPRRPPSRPSCPTVHSDRPGHHQCYSPRSPKLQATKLLEGCCTPA